MYGVEVLINAELSLSRPGQAFRGPGDSGSANAGGRVVSPSHRPP